MNSLSDDNRILVIDDDAVFCSIVESGLTHRGFTVTIAHDGKTALEAARCFEPASVLLDLKLAEDSGLRLIKPLLELNRELKIVVLTGYGSITTAVEAIKAGAVNYVAKPVDIDTILSAFESYENGPEKAGEAKPMSMKRLEWEHLQRILDEHGGNISASARSLGMHRRTLQRKLKKRPVKW